MVPKRSSTSIIINPRKALATNKEHPKQLKDMAPAERVCFHQGAYLTSSTTQGTTEVDENDLRLRSTFNNGALKVIGIIGKNEADTGHIEYLAMLAPPFKLGEVVWRLASNFFQVDIEEFEQRDCEIRRWHGLPIHDYTPPIGRPLKLEPAIERASNRRLAMGIPTPPPEVVDVRDPGHHGVPLNLTATDGTPITGYWRAKTE